MPIHEGEIPFEDLPKDRYTTEVREYLIGHKFHVAEHLELETYYIYHRQEGVVSGFYDTLEGPAGWVVARADYEMGETGYLEMVIEHAGRIPSIDPELIERAETQLADLRKDRELFKNVLSQIRDNATVTNHHSDPGFYIRFPGEVIAIINMAIPQEADDGSEK